MFSIFGFPRCLISDNGTAFTSKEFCDFMYKCGIHHKRSSHYYAESNGVVERFHGTLKARVDRLLSDGVAINEALSQAMYDIRSLPNNSIGVTPFFRFFGREMPTRWQNVNKREVKKTANSLIGLYEGAKSKGKFKLIHFDAGEEVLVRRGRNGKFSESGVIVRKAGHGAWLIKVNGRERVVNQRFLCRLRHKQTHTNISCDIVFPSETVNAHEERQIQDFPDAPYNLRPNRRCVFEHFYH